MTIWFDMDGTLADLYGVPDWLAYLRAENPAPYRYARPLLRMQSLARVLNRLHRAGYEIGIISWLSKVSTPDYDRAVTEAKRAWLAQHLKSVQFNFIDIVPYGTPKSDGRDGILFDDEARNRADWKGLAFDEIDILSVLRSL